MLKTQLRVGITEITEGSAVRAGLGSVDLGGRARMIVSGWHVNLINRAVRLYSQPCPIPNSGFRRLAKPGVRYCRTQTFAPGAPCAFQYGKGLRAR